MDRETIGQAILVVIALGKVRRMADDPAPEFGKMTIEWEWRHGRVHRPVIRFEDSSDERPPVTAP